MEETKITLYHNQPKTVCSKLVTKTAQYFVKAVVMLTCAHSAICCLELVINKKTVEKEYATIPFADDHMIRMVNVYDLKNGDSIGFRVSQNSGSEARVQESNISLTLLGKQ